MVEDGAGNYYARNNETGIDEQLFDHGGVPLNLRNGWEGQQLFGVETINGENSIGFKTSPNSQDIHVWTCGTGWTKTGAVNYSIELATQLFSGDTAKEEYVLSLNSSSLTEGDMFTSTVNTTNVAENTRLYWSVSGKGITSDDFSFGVLSGSGIVNSNGEITFSHTLANDLRTEGTEMFSINLFTDEERTQEVAIADVTIQDSSVTPFIGNGIGFIRNESYYTLIEGSSRSQASANARSIGGHLVDINSSEENSAIYSFFSSKTNTNSSWIGISKNSNGSWVDSNGEISNLNFWAPGEPNNSYYGNIENYAVLVFNDSQFGSGYAGKWNDLPNDVHSLPYTPWSDINSGIAEIELSNFSITNIQELHYHIHTEGNREHGPADFRSVSGIAFTLTRSGGSNTNQNLFLSTTPNQPGIIQHNQSSQNITFTKGETSKNIYYRMGYKYDEAVGDEVVSNGTWIQFYEDANFSIQLGQRQSLQSPDYSLNIEISASSTDLVPAQIIDGSRKLNVSVIRTNSPIWFDPSGVDESATSSGDGNAANSGDESATNSGDGSAVSSGDGSAVSSGDGSAVNSGDGSAVSSGDGSAVSSGDGSATNSGDNNVVNSGDESVTNSGDNNTIVNGSGNTSDIGDDSVVNSGNNNNTVSGDGNTTDIGDDNVVVSGDNNSTNSNNGNTQNTIVTDNSVTDNSVTDNSVTDNSTTTIVDESVTDNSVIDSSTTTIIDESVTNNSTTTTIDNSITDNSTTTIIDNSEITTIDNSSTTSVTDNSTLFDVVVNNDNSQNIESITNNFVVNNVINNLNVEVANYQLNSNEYQFYNFGSNRYGIDSENGIDEITGVSTLIFADRTMSVANDIKATFDQVTGLNDVTGQIFRLYNAAFNRLPDASGLNYWINQNRQGLNTQTQIAESFIASSEFVSMYGTDSTTDQFVTSLYNNVLDRDPDVGGLNYWTNTIDSGLESRSQVLQGFSESQENQTTFSQMTGFI